MNDSVITKDTLGTLANYVGLPLNDARKQAILPILQSWVPAANALSSRMAENEVRNLVPRSLFASTSVAEYKRVI